MVESIHISYLSFSDFFFILSIFSSIDRSLCSPHPPSPVISSSLPLTFLPPLLHPVFDRSLSSPVPFLLNRLPLHNSPVLHHLYVSHLHSTPPTSRPSATRSSERNRRTLATPHPIQAEHRSLPKMVRFTPPMILLRSGVSGSERSLLPLSTIYNWSCGHFSKPLLGGTDASQEIVTKREEKEKFALEHIAKYQHSSFTKLNNNPIANWDTRFETGTKTILLHPFSPIVVAADENERIRVWNYEEATLLNGFDNHDFPDKGISKLCLVNELDDSLLLVASCDGSVRIWKNYATKGKQKLVTGFSSIHGHKPGARGLNAVVDWQQQSGYLYSSGEVSTVSLWDLEKEQLVRIIPSESECGVTALTR